MKKTSLRRIFVTVGMFSLVFFAAGKNSLAAETGEETIHTGVYIGTTDVSGMTAEEAADAAKKEAQKELADEVTLTVGSSKVTVSAADLGMTWLNQEVAEEAVRLGKSGNIVKRYKDNKDLENKTKKYELTFAADQEKIKSYLVSQKEELDCDAVDGTLERDENGNLVAVPGVTGVILNVDQSAAKVYDYMMQSWRGDGGTIALAADEEEPRGTAEELAQVKDVLGTATTYYGSTYERNTNIEVGASKLNGTLLYPGESFSVTAAVVPFTAENGYELAPSYESGKVVDSYGGGICQVSTTLYNAVLKAELDVLERHNHTMIVTYVDPSKDAAIAEGLMDLQFANNTDYPIYIEGYGYGGELSFTIYGKETRSADRTVEYVSETVSSTEPDGVKLYAKSDADVGYINQTQSSHTGVEARLWKVVTENGETTRTQVNSSTYQATPPSYDIGINSSDPNIVAQIQTAIANNDLESVQRIIATGSTQESETESTETQSSETQSQAETTPQAPETQAPETQATEAPETQAPEEGIDPPEPDGMATAVMQ